MGQTSRKLEGLRLGIASADSGIAATFGYMSSRLTGLLDISVRYGDTRPLMKTAQ